MSKWFLALHMYIDMKISIIVLPGMISLTSEYGIRALIALRQQPEGIPLGAKEMSEITGIPRNYLSKVMHALVRAGIVSSGRGPGGGFVFLRPPAEVTAHEVVMVFEDISGQRRCFLGNATCDDDVDCAAHEGWKTVWDTFEEFLRTTTIQDLSPSDIPPGVQSKPGRG
jgi:Rrf2 family protein